MPRLANSMTRAATSCAAGSVVAASPSVAQASKNADEQSLDDLPSPIWYDEWNADRGRYVKPGAAVRVSPAEDGDSQWARDTLHRHGSIVRQIRHEFERLRARRAHSRLPSS